jgi:hypothetical protein
MRVVNNGSEVEITLTLAEAEVLDQVLGVVLDWNRRIGVLGEELELIYRLVEEL